jgi:NADH:ubiquinone oxidoreductase subunit 3 (subunit A)
MPYKALLSPPFAFLILTLTAGLLMYLSKYLALGSPKPSEQSKKAYSCGEQFSGHLIQPDYSQFFPFAFFFTILHVIALVIATVPTETIGVFAVALVYITGAVTGLLILLRK